MFKVTLLTNKDELYVGLASKIILPTEEGEITILDFHQPILSRLAEGVISIDDRWLFKIRDGVAKMSGFEFLGIVNT
jgi:F0F1-type ATP synthase epsilon subunit